MSNVAHKSIMAIIGRMKKARKAAANCTFPADLDLEILETTEMINDLDSTLSLMTRGSTEKSLLTMARSYEVKALNDLEEMASMRETHEANRLSLLREFDNVISLLNEVIFNSSRTVPDSKMLEAAFKKFRLVHALVAEKKKTAAVNSGESQENIALCMRRVSKTISVDWKDYLRRSAA